MLEIKKLVPLLNLIFGILCIGAVVAAFVGYGPVMSLIGGLIIYHLGIYLPLVGSIGILLSGILGLQHEKKEKLSDEGEK